MQSKPPGGTERTWDHPMYRLHKTKMCICTKWAVGERKKRTTVSDEKVPVWLRMPNNTRCQHLVWYSVHQTWINYYAATKTKTRKDLCVYCAKDGAQADKELLLAAYKTVLPMCQDCKALGKDPLRRAPLQTPAGKRAAKTVSGKDTRKKQKKWIQWLSVRRSLKRTF